MATGRMPSAHKGRRTWVLVVAIAGLVVALLSTFSSTARADERDDVASRQEESAAKVDQLKADLNGFDAALAQVYLDLEDLRGKIPVAQGQLDAANVRFEAATRQHQIAIDQLETAKAEQDRLDAEVKKAQADQARATGAIAGLAREMYRGEVASPVMLAMTAKGTEEIGDRAVDADALARSQNKAMDEARNLEVTQRNRAERQDAVAARITTLEEKAQNAAAEAGSAQASAQAKVAELDSLKTRADAKAAEWESSKAVAAEQLNAWQAEYDATTARLAQIDEANRLNGIHFGGDGTFRSPLPIPLVVTSSFGWRTHPVLGTSNFHNGTDFASPCGLEQYPVAPGVIAAVTYVTAGGNVVYIYHGMINGDSWMSAHVHLDSSAVYVGQNVDRSTVIGYTGSTGYSTGCHLHLSMMKNGVDVDPMDYL